MTGEASGEFSNHSTLFDVFAFHGFFWLPDTPDCLVSGIITYSPDSIELQLFGSLEKHARPKHTVGQSVAYEVIQARTQYGKLLTLCHCSEWKIDFPIPGVPPSSRVSVSYLIVGGHFVSLDAVRFPALSVQFLHLEEWVGHRPFGYETAATVATGAIFHKTIIYRSPETKTFRIQALNANLEIESNAWFREEPYSRFNSEHIALFTVRPDAPQPLDWWVKRISELQNLLTLLMDAPTSPKRLVCNGFTQGDSSYPVRTDLNLFYKPFHKFDRVRVSPHEMLVPYKKAVTVFESVVNSWFSKSESLEIVSDLYFGVTYNPYLYLQFAFLGLIQAIETYCRQFQDGQYLPEDEYEKVKQSLINAIPEGTPQDLRENLTRGRIRFGNEYSLRKRLQNLLRSFENQTRQLVAENTAEFCEDIVGTRNYLTHFTSELKSRALSGQRLAEAYFRLRMLITIVLLKELQIPEEIIRGFLDSSYSRLANAVRVGYGATLNEQDSRSDTT